MAAFSEPFDSCESSGSECRVRDENSGYEFNLSSLKGRDYAVAGGKYTYHLSVCGGLDGGACPHQGARTDPDIAEVASCQVDGNKHKIAGSTSAMQVPVKVPVQVQYRYL